MKQFTFPNETKFEIGLDLMNDLIAYLRLKPFEEVAIVMNGLNDSVIKAQDDLISVSEPKIENNDKE